MALRELILEHDVDLPRPIVWDALTDAELTSGWLGHAVIDPVVGGRYSISWVGRPVYAGIDGTIDALAAPGRLVIATVPGARTEFLLDERSGGFRGTWTRLRVTVVVDDVDHQLALLSESWTIALNQLDELLRGHPVDWRGNRRAPRPARGAGSA